MSTTNGQLITASFLKSQRQIPNDDLRGLSKELDQLYIDVAQKVNDRIIGTFAVGFPVTTGEVYFLAGGVNRQQTLRQVYTFTGAGNVAHGINFSSITQFTRCWGEYTDGTNWYGVIFATSVGIAGQVTFSLTSSNIVIVVDGAAPAVSSGTIVLEWLSQV